MWSGGWVTCGTWRASQLRLTTGLPLSLPKTEPSVPPAIERLSIRLPRGFVPVSDLSEPGKPHYNFFRLHADLETVAAISIRVVPIADLGLAERSKPAAMATLIEKVPSFRRPFRT